MLLSELPDLASNTSTEPDTLTTTYIFEHIQYIVGRIAQPATVDGFEKIVVNFFSR
jgi:hypothetical protein